VLAELAIAAIHPAYDSFWERWGSSFAGGLVAIGVAFEIKFGQMAGLRQNELKRRSDQKVGDANARAAEAEAHAAEANQKAQEAALEFARFRAPRSLTHDQMVVISEKLRKFSGTEFDAAVQSSDPEILGFLTLIQLTLAWAGWKPLPFIGSVMVTYAMPGIQVGTGFAVAGTVMEINREFAGALQRAATALVEELNAIGIKAVASMPLNPPSRSANKQAIHIFVGRKT
jgi:hypothetical protein